MKHEGKGDEETTRSGLFIEQMRIVKEMREHDRATGRSGRFVRPRYMVWENVPGALSSPGKEHKGEDFAAVLEEIIKVAEPGASLRVRVPAGGWANSGCYYAEDGSRSIAWRVHDAQYWGTTQYVDGRVLFPGTPQRRRRIALVADFGGLCAPEVLFERKGLSRDLDESEEAWQGTPSGAEGGLGAAISFQERAGKPGGEKGILIQNEHIGALSTLQIQHIFDGRGINGNDGNPSFTLNTIERHEVCSPVAVDVYNQTIDGETAATVTAACGGTNTSGPKVMTCGWATKGNGEVAGALDASYYKGCGTRLGVERDVLPTEPLVLEGNQNHATVTQRGVSPTLPASMGMGGGYIPMVVEPVAFAQNQRDEMRDIEPGQEARKNSAAGTRRGSSAPICFDARGNGDGETACTITGDHNNRISDYTVLVLPFDTTQVTSPDNYSHPHPGDPCHPLAAGAHPPAVCIGNGQLHNISMQDTANTLDTMHDAQAVIIPVLAHALKSKSNCDFREDSETYVATAVDCRNFVESDGANGTLQAKSNGGWNANSNAVCRVMNMVRRLTPTECERLQNYPDGYTDIGDWVDENGKRRKVADGPRYKALGNSICLPFWFWLMRRISAQYDRPATLGSLFDGIGGFPYVWEQCNGKGTAVWASEIEPFCIAVTKKHFPEEE